MPFKQKIHSGKLKGLFSIFGREEILQVNEGAQTQSLTPVVSPCCVSGPSVKTKTTSSQIPATPILSPPPSWEAWSLDQDFLCQVYDWNATHPENRLDRILNDTCALISRHRELLEIVPDGPIPFRGFVKALAHLVQLGATIIEAKAIALGFAQDILQWVEKLASSFGNSESGQFVLETWQNLATIRKLIEEICSWAHRMLNGGLTERVSVNDEILRFKMRFTQATEHFVVLSGIVLARSQDTLVRGLNSIIQGQDTLIRGQDSLVQMVQSSDQSTIMTLPSNLLQRFNLESQS